MERKESPKVNQLLLRLPDEANVVECETLALHEVHLERFFLCEHYDTCLSITALLLWKSFTCKHCPIWARAKLAKEAK